MRVLLLNVIVLGLVGSAAMAQDRRGIRFWNLTLYTITSHLHLPRLLSPRSLMSRLNACAAQPSRIHLGCSSLSSLSAALRTNLGGRGSRVHHLV